MRSAVCTGRRRRGARAAAGSPLRPSPPRPTPSSSRNGDRLTGEVVQMRQGKLQVKTDDAGTLSIEWDKVASITTADLYDVTMRDGCSTCSDVSPGRGAASWTRSRSAGTSTPVADGRHRVVRAHQERDSSSASTARSISAPATRSRAASVSSTLDADATYRRPAYSDRHRLLDEPHAPARGARTPRGIPLKVVYTRYRGAIGGSSRRSASSRAIEELGFTIPWHGCRVGRPLSARDRSTSSASRRADWRRGRETPSTTTA